MRVFLFIALFLFNTQIGISASDRVNQLPGFGPVNDLEFAGYLPLKSKTTNNERGKLFYWYVQNRATATHAPIVLWLNGGPGAASLYGFFMENGPYIIHENGTLTQRKYSWSQQADYLIIDQPAGVGLSIGDSSSFKDESESIDQLYDALQLFFQKHPNLRSKPLYLAGESYAGKTLPQLAIRILKEKQRPKIQLQGLMVGDGWVNPRVQQAANIDYAYYHGLIDAKGREKVKRLYQACSREILKETPSSRQANHQCEKIQNYIQQQSGNLNLANISTGVEPSDATMVRYLNRIDVQHALHLEPHLKHFATFDQQVAKKLEIGEQDSVDSLYTQLLNRRIPILLYNGLEDGKDSNFLSTELWLAALQWPYQKEFQAASTCIWRVKGQVAGYVKSIAGLTQIKIRGAGHLAPIDQPHRLFDLFNRWIKKERFCTGENPF